MKQLKWFDSDSFYVDLDIVNKDEMLELWKITRDIDAEWNVDAWKFKDNMLIIESFPLDYDLDIRLSFVHIIGEIEKRISDEDTDTSDEDKTKQVQKQSYYEEK